MEQKILEMIGITKTYPGVRALDNVNFDLGKGDVHILAGENGAGKSTLVKILSGAERMDSGKIEIFGQEINITSPQMAQSVGISVIYQEFNLINSLSIAENIFIGKEPLHRRSRFINWHILRTRARLILDMLGLKRDVKTLVGELSVAEQQIVEIGKALSFDAKIIAMDEPSASLSERELDNLFRLINVLKLKGIGIIFISHRIEELYKIGDRVSILRDGILIDTKPVSELSRGELITKMVGRELKQEFPKVNFKRGNQVMRLENVWGERKIEDINLKIYQGELLGISGLVGSGRTELARIIYGADKKEKGNIFLNGEKVDINSPYEAIKLGIGLLTEDRNREGLILGMNIPENITIANLRSVVKNGLINKKKEKEVTSNYINELKIKTPSLSEIVDNLSGGNRQKIILARWLFTNSKVIIFDEPTRGIDVGAKLEIYHLINNLISKGIAVVMISSELSEILGMCDRIAVMCKGRIAGILSRKKASQEKIMNLAMEGE